MDRNGTGGWNSRLQLPRHLHCSRWLRSCDLGLRGGASSMVAFAPVISILGIGHCNFRRAVHGPWTSCSSIIEAEGSYHHVGIIALKFRDSFQKLACSTTRIYLLHHLHPRYETPPQEMVAFVRTAQWATSVLDASMGSPSHACGAHLHSTNWGRSQR